MGEFTFELNEDQKQVRDWLHGFAADVMRPAAAEWDEREETPGRSSRRRPSSESTPSTSTPSSSSTRPASASP